MTRSRILLAGFCLALLPLSAVAEVKNVVLILSDDQAWTDYGFMGHPHVQTPHIDKLARESRTFTRGYVPDSLCRPSLATLITGRYPHQHKIVGNDPPFPEAVADLPRQEARFHPGYFAAREEFLQHIDRENTLPKILRAERGMLCYQTGKWWEGNYSRGGFTGGMTHGDPEKRGRHGDDGLRIGRRTMQPITDFLKRAQERNKPFFLWYAPMMPHLPHNPPERILEKYVDKTPHLALAKYWAMCEWFDETVGTLLGMLDEQGLAEETLVVYVCDNGWISLNGTSEDSPRSKRSQYDGGVRTPIMFRLPGVIEPALDTTHPVSSIDIVPTILATLGIHTSYDLPGINVLDDAALASRPAVFGEIFEHDIQHVTNPEPSLRFRWVVEGDWKLIVPHQKREPDGELELFEITKDPFEERNIADQHPEVVARLKNRLDENWNPEE